MLLIAGSALAFGVGAVSIARGHPDFSVAGDASWASAAQLAAGWGLVAAALADWAKRPHARSAPLFAAAGASWFLVEFANPEVGSSVVFTGGLVLFAACPPLVADAAFARRSARSPVEAAIVAAGYVAAVGLLGLGAAALYDPAGQGCLECPADLVHVAGNTGEYHALTHAALWALLDWAVIVIALLTWRLVRTSAVARRLDAPVIVPAVMFLVLVALDAAHSIGRGYESNDATDRAIWTGQALTLIALALGVSWERIRSRRMRAELARLVVQLDTPRPGGVAEVLARAFGDGYVSLAYPTRNGGWLDANGGPVKLPADATFLGPDDAPAAAVAHPPAAFEDPDLVDEIYRAARPTLEHERLTAEVRARLAELRASRRRIVAAADAERRRLERDLHDGAQQRIVALALDLRLARRRLMRQRPELDAELGAAEDELRVAVAELRDVARGICPPLLEDRGLTAALNALAEDAPRLSVGDLPTDRAPTGVEAAAYHLVTEALRATPSGRVAVRGALDGTTLSIEVAPEAGAPESLIDAEDRIGALGGRLAWHDGRLLAELPCA
jgi:signal transduction histidine kinase